ncbi:MAG: acyl-CoA synthetase [Pseudomonadales bacterium]|nr:acyl-CoA synthetase [Pseudomonadales bacterium]
MPSSSSIYEQNLEKNPANYAQLSPLSFFSRTVDIYPDMVSVVHGNRTYTWAETYSRCSQLASSLQTFGIKRGDTVAILAANTPEMFEAHFGIPMAGGVINAINTRLDAATVRFILEHGEAKIFFVDSEFAAVASDAISDMESPPRVVNIIDPLVESAAIPGNIDYEAFISTGDARFEWTLPEDEWEAIALSYTSGTTGDPKGVVTHHRGAYLNSVSMALTWNMGEQPVYLWTLPMFHCNGWCFPWTLAVNGGVSVCLRQVRVEEIFEAIRDHQVTHFCGAPIVLNTLLGAADNYKAMVDHKVRVMTAGAAPPAAVIEGMEEMGFDVTHVYGLTETYGPCTTCQWRGDLWDSLPAGERAARKARQGVRGHMLEGLMVADPESLEPVPKDGETIGEIFMRGNLVMKGYLKNPDTTEKEFRGGWFHSGDLAVWHSDGYIQIKDRSKDVIISGGENISSIEIEDTLYRHPDVLEAAVVAKFDEKWGETPCAFITLKEGRTTSVEHIISFCRDNMARFKVPKTVIFGTLPKTSTGKIQKYLLREKAENNN